MHVDNNSVNRNFFSIPLPFSSFFCSIYHKIADQFIPYNDLNTKRNKLKGRATHSVNSENFQLISVEFMQKKPVFAKKSWENFKGLSPYAFKSFILQILATQADEKKVFKCLENFLQSLTVKDLEKFLELSSEEIQNLLNGDASLNNSFVKSSLQLKSLSIQKTIFNEAFYLFHYILENLVSCTGLTELGAEEDSFELRKIKQYEAKNTLDFYLTLLTYPSVIFTGLLAYTKHTASAFLLTLLTIISILAITRIYMHFLKPCPNHFLGLENLNQKVIEQKTAPIFKRMDILEAIQSAFSSGKGVILTANPGEGKTTIVQSLAELIVSKECKHFLTKAQLFSANANRLNSYESSLDRIERKFKNYPKGFILFLDEIESFFKDSLVHVKLSDSLLTFQHKFNYIICATTTEQYNRTIKDKEESFSRRFKHIEITPLKDKDIEIALYDYLHFKAPELTIDEEVIPYLIEKVKDSNCLSSIIDTAIALLACTISKATTPSFQTLEKEIQILRGKIELYNKSHLHKSCPVTPEEIEKYQKNLQNFKDKQAELTKKQSELQKIKRIEKIYTQLKNSSYSLAANSVNNQNSLHKKKWLVNQVCCQILLSFIQNNRLKIGLPSKITTNLIDEILKENPIQKAIKVKKVKKESFLISKTALSTKYRRANRLKMSDFALGETS
jgi:energy-coupling factor transporter ATP-binding protein EcfA2